MSKRWLLLPALLLAGCDSPTQVVEQYHLALAEGRGAKALSLLSQRTRDELARRAQAAHEASGGTVSKDPAAMINQGDSGMYPYPEPNAKLAKVKVLKVEGAQALVEVEAGGEKGELTLLRESGRWKIDLPLAGPKP